MAPAFPCTRRWLTGSSAIMMMVVGVPPNTSAASQCSVHVIPEHPSAAWEEAIDRARASLASQPGDCGETVIEVAGDFATLKFTTRDGRRAVRLLRDPSELSAVLGALVVTLPAPTFTPAPAKSAAPTSQSVRAPVAEAHPAAAPINALLSGLVGARLAGPGPLVGPTAILGAGIGLPRWELGLITQWTPSYAILTDDTTRPARFAGISAGLAIGRRTSLNKNLTLVTGITLSAAAQHEGWHMADATTGKKLHEENDRGQALVGAYAGAVFPLIWKMRLRSSISADVDATHLGDTGQPASGVPRLPWWALTLAFGFETEIL